ncbi:MAG: hypothetical protein K6E68_05935 [Lachnospiraceae bacterium]|nr:hypothetical protein [Lachnospiraceae bacterium]
MGEGILSKEELNKLLGKEDDLLRKSGRAVESSGKPGKERLYMRELFFCELRDRLNEIASEYISDSGDVPNKDEKRLIDAIMMIRRLCNTARERGLLELEDMASKIDNTDLGKYLKKLIMLVVDGTDPALVEEIGYSLYLSGYYRGYEGLIALIYLEGVLSFQAGEHPVVIEEKLYALVPSYIRDLRETIGNAEETGVEDFYVSSRLDIDTICKQDSKLVPTDNGYHLAKLVEFCLEQLDKRSMMRLLRDIDNCDLVICIVAFDGNARRKIFDSISEKLGNMLAEDIWFMGPIRVNDVMEAVTKVMNVYIKLIDGGEIATDNSELIRMINAVFAGRSETEETTVQRNARYLRNLVDRYETDNNRLIYIV